MLFNYNNRAGITNKNLTLKPWKGAVFYSANN